MPIIPTHPRADLRECGTMWVARDLDDPSVVWTWTQYRDSWNLRAPYKGATPVDELPRAVASVAFATGWPGARPEVKAQRQKPARELRTCTLQVKTTLDVRDAIVAAANAAKKSVSTFTHDLITEALAARAAASSAAAPAGESAGTQPPP